MARVQLTTHQVTKAGRRYQYWQLRWADPQTGRRRAKTLGSTSKIPVREARKQRDLQEAELEHSPDRANPDRIPALEDWIDYFLRWKRSEGVSERSLKLYEHTGRLLISYFGPRTRIDEINRTEAHSFRTAMLEGGIVGEHQGSRPPQMGRTTVDKHLQKARTIFAAAIDDDREILARNPFRRVVSSQPARAEWRKVTLEEFWRLYEAARPALRPVIALARLAALSRQDALALRWRDVDLENGVLDYRRAKTGVSVRRVPICAELEHVLRSLDRETLRSDALVVSPRPYLENLGRDWNWLLKRAGVEPYGSPLHALRKSCIDDWSKRFNLTAVHAWAGHTSIATTQEYYTQVSRSDEVAARGSLAGETDAKSDATGRP